MIWKYKWVLSVAAGDLALKANQLIRKMDLGVQGCSGKMTMDWTSHTEPTPYYIEKMTKVLKSKGMYEVGLEVFEVEFIGATPIADLHSDTLSYEKEKNEDVGNT